MLSFVLQRVARVVLMLISVEVLIFLLVHAVPGGPWDSGTNQVKAMGNVFVDSATLESRAKYYGFDLPLWRQFTRYIIGDTHEKQGFVCGVVCGNLGPSTKRAGQSVQSILFEPLEGHSAWESRFGFTVRLVTYAFGLVIGLGLPLGVTSALWARSSFDRGVTAVLTALASMPVFVLGLLNIMIFASWLKWIKVLPDWSQPKYWIIPTLLLAVIPLANMTRLTRTAMLNAMSGDYIRTARAKGLRRLTVIWKHVLPNALITILTFLLPLFAELLAASFIIEGIFGFPGFGREFWEAIGNRDYSMIMGVALIYASAITLASLLLDMLYHLIDPRLRSQA